LYEPLWDKCDKQSKLFVCIHLLNIKSTLNVTQIIFNKFIDFTKNYMSNDKNLVSSFYDAKKFMQPFGLVYEKYDMCPNYCILYNRVDAMKINYDFYGSSWYKPRNPTNKCSNKVKKQF